MSANDISRAALKGTNTLVDALTLLSKLAAIVGDIEEDITFHSELFRELREINNLHRQAMGEILTAVETLGERIKLLEGADGPVEP